jgi:hypothetical protein
MTRPARSRSRHRDAKESARQCSRDIGPNECSFSAGQQPGPRPGPRGGSVARPRARSRSRPRRPDARPPPALQTAPAPRHATRRRGRVDPTPPRLAEHDHARLAGRAGHDARRPRRDRRRSRTAATHSNARSPQSCPTHRGRPRSPECAACGADHAARLRAIRSGQLPREIANRPPGPIVVDRSRTWGARLPTGAALPASRSPAQSTVDVADLTGEPDPSERAWRQRPADPCQRPTTRPASGQVP